MVALFGTFMALVGIGLFCAAGVVHERWANALRLPVRREHRCGKCAYDLHGVEVDVCPECGIDRARIEPLPERRRLAMAGWMAPAVLACLFGLATTAPEMIGLALLGAVFTAVLAVVCRKIPMIVYFGALGIGLMFSALGGLAQRAESDAGEAVLATIAAAALFGVPLVTVFVYLWLGRLYSDRPKN